MAEYFRHLYIGKTAAGMEKKIRRYVERGKDIPGVRLITLASNGVDQLDIIPLLCLKQKHVRERLPVVAGLAGSREEAIEVVREMIRDAVQDTGSCDLRSWLVRTDGGYGRSPQEGD